MKAPRCVPFSLSLLGACLLLAGSLPAHASDLYVTALLGVAGGNGDTGGAVNLGAGNTPIPNTGSDSDGSPVYALAFGFETLFPEFFPEGWDTDFPEFAVRTELELGGGRDHELVTGGSDTFVTSVNSWTGLMNVWTDLPVRGAIEPLFGRVPLLDPLNFVMGAGLGVGLTFFDSSNNVAFGDDDAAHFVWQAGTGFGYELTDRVTLGAEYRYVGFGSHTYPLVGTVGEPVGSFSIDLGSHEFVAGVRVRFYGVPSPGTWGSGGAR